MSCTKVLSFEENVRKADAVFEGRFVKYRMERVNTPNKEHSFNFNKPGYYVLITTLVAEKAYKGIDVGQEAEFVFAWPIPKDARAEFLRRTKAENPYKDGKIFALTKIKYGPDDTFAEPVEDPSQFNKYYYDTFCGGRYDITTENIKILQKIFPAAAQ